MDNTYDHEAARNQLDFFFGLEDESGLQNVATKAAHISSSYFVAKDPDETSRLAFKSQDGAVELVDVTIIGVLGSSWLLPFRGQGDSHMKNQTVELLGMGRPWFDEYTDALGILFTTFERAYPPNRLKPWKVDDSQRLTFNSRIFTPARYTDEPNVDVEYEIDPQGTLQTILKEGTLKYTSENQVFYGRRQVNPDGSVRRPRYSSVSFRKGDIVSIHVSINVVIAAHKSLRFKPILREIVLLDDGLSKKLAHNLYTLPKTSQAIPKPWGLKRKRVVEESDDTDPDVRFVGQKVSRLRLTEEED